MPALMIVYADVTDPAAFKSYTDAVYPFFSERGAATVAFGRPDVVEGDWPWQAAVVFGWPSREAALEAWRSPEYAAIKRLREGAAVFQCIVVEGAAPSHG